MENKVSNFYKTTTLVPEDQKWFCTMLNSIIIDGTILPKKNPSKWFKDHAMEEVYQKFLITSSHFDPMYSFGDRVKLLLLGHWTSSPTCKLCGKPVKLKDQYPFSPREYCSKGCAGKAPESISKARSTSISKYGVDNPSKSPAVIDKIRQAHIDRYGYDNVSQSPEIKAKKIITHKKNHGESYPFQLRHVGPRSHFSDSTWDKISDPDWLYQQCVVDRKSPAEVAFELGDITSDPILLRIKELGYYDLVSGSFRRMNVPETHIMTYLETIIPTHEIQRNVRSILPSGKELDFYLPEYNLAIEVNGSYWHSTYDPLYHQQKKQECCGVGIDLIHVYEHDIHDPRRFNVIKSIIQSRLGNCQKIGARKLNVKFTNASEVRGFFDDNHMDGFLSASHYLVLVDDADTIFQAVSLGRSRFDKKYDFELYRLCTKQGITVVGGISKLLKHFQQSQPGSIISYVNFDYFSGSSFKTWNFVKITDPGYFWSNGKVVISRYQAQKQNLKSLLGDKYNPLKTERENMTTNNYHRVHTSGSKVYYIN